MLGIGGWNELDLRVLGSASSVVSGGVFNEELIYADLSANDAFWRILSLVDPYRIDVQPRYQFVSIYARLRNILASSYELPSDEIDEVARPIAGFLTDLMSRLSRRGREPIDGSLRAQLVDLSDSHSCWYCGARFGDSMIDAFIARKQKDVDLPRYVDFVTQRGTIPRDLRMEVDHLTPVAAGGGTDIANLRLACGWCNRHKRELKSLYDVGSMPINYVHPRGGTWLLPAPYWVIRILGTRRRCEWPAGCTVRIENEQLYAAPRNQFGAMVPGNIGAFCRCHDPLIDERLVPNRCN